MNTQRCGAFTERGGAYFNMNTKRCGAFSEGVYVTTETQLFASSYIRLAYIFEASYSTVVTSVSKKSSVDQSELEKQVEPPCQTYYMLEDGAHLRPGACQRKYGIHFCQDIPAGNYMFKVNNKNTRGTLNCRLR